MPIQELVTPDFLRATMPGVKLQTFDKVPFSDEFLQQAIDQSVRFFETKYSVSLTGSPALTTTIKHDVRWSEAETWYLKQMPIRPVAKITKFEFRFGNYPPASIDLRWLAIRDPIEGVVQIIPGPGGVTTTLAAGLRSTGTMGGGTFGMFPYTPDLLHYSYVAGFESDLPQATVTNGNALVTFDADMTDMSNVTQLSGVMMTYGAILSLGGVLYKVQRVTTAGVTLTRPYEGATGVVDAIWYRYDPLFLAGVRDYAALEVVTAANDTVTKEPGLVSASIGIEGMNQAKSFNPRGPYSNRIALLRERLKETHTALRRLYGEVNLFVE